jgi:predicted TPR repeat methyltransferase
LALHYVQSFEDVLNKINKCLSKGGDFVFSVEHPIFTSQGPQDWYYDEKGNIVHWPVDS